MRVLIVEDELRMASLIRRGLTNEGLAADVAARGADALWMAEAHDYDAVLLDVMLPDIDGFEVCRRLRGGRRVGAGADADRARLRRGPRGGSRQRRRRLPREAVRPSRSCSPACGRSRVAATVSAPRFSSSTIFASTRRPER